MSDPLKGFEETESLWETYVYKWKMKVKEHRQ